MMKRIIFLVLLGFSFLISNGQEEVTQRALIDYPPQVQQGIMGKVGWMNFLKPRTGNIIPPDESIMCWDRDKNRIGIGTLYPSQKLEVNGNISLANSGSYITKVKGIYFTWDARYGTQFQHGIFSTDGNDYSDDITLNSYGNVRINFDSNNNGTNVFSIGHNTTGLNNTIFKIDENGLVTVKEIKVTLIGWSDFVFEPDYNLMTLKDLETFIKTNKHLPEIPTTDEVKENGISVGEMNAKLLQKIEELTLYLIQQDEKINVVIKENNTLKKQIEELNNVVKK